MPSHLPLLVSVFHCSSAIVAADFNAGGCNILELATVTGKRKKGALKLHPSTVLCSVVTKGGKQYKVRLGRRRIAGFSWAVRARRGKVN